MSNVQTRVSLEVNDTPQMLKHYYTHVITFNNMGKFNNYSFPLTQNS